MKWAGAPDSEEPAALVKTYDLALEEGQGQLGALAELRQAAAAGEGAETPETAAPDEDDDQDADDGDTGTLLGGAALVVSLVALLMSFRSRRS